MDMGSEGELTNGDSNVTALVPAVQPYLKFSSLTYIELICRPLATVALLKSVVERVPGSFSRGLLRRLACCPSQHSIVAVSLPLLQTS